MELSNLGSSAKDLLDAFAAELALVPGFTPLAGNRYVGAGEIPWDKPGLYVYVGSGVTGQVGSPSQQPKFKTQAITFSISFYVQILRLVATFAYWENGGINTADDNTLMANGITAVNDAGALLSCAAIIMTNGEVVTNPQAGFTIGPVVPVGPYGGMAAMRLQIDVGIERA